MLVLIHENQSKKHCGNSNIYDFITSVYLYHILTREASKNRCPRKKTFDTVRHSVLADELAPLAIPGNIFNRPVHCTLENSTKFRGQISVSASIIARVVHRCGVGSFSMTST